MEQLKSTPITNLDAQPIVVATSGEGAPGRMHAATDALATTASAAANGTYRLCRFPTNAKVKKVQLYTSGIEAITTQTPTLDINVAFSDSTTDGTPVALQATIPSNKRDNTSVAYSGTTGYGSYNSTGTGNKLFGVAITSNTQAGSKNQEITFANTTAAQGFFPANRDDDLWNVLGFQNASGVAQDPGGFFDIFVVIAAVTSGAVGVIGVEVDFVG